MTVPRLKNVPWKRLLVHPLWILAGGVLLTQWLGDGHYPFSNFPMYSRLGNEATYTYLTDLEGRPLSTGEHVMLSAAKVNKMYHSTLRQICQRDRHRISKAPPEATQEAVTEVLGTLREINREAGRPPLPPRVKVFQVIIELRDGKLRESSRVVGEG